MRSPEEARIRKLEERNMDLINAIKAARDELGKAIAFADPYSPEDVKVSKKALRDAEKILRPFDHRVSDSGAKSVPPEDGQ